MSAGRHARAIGLLPVMATIIVPAVLLRGDVDLAPWPLVVLGGACVVGGGAFFVWTVVLLARLGRGTLAPWDPTSRLVVAGPYRHVRNPMISAVLAVLAGEAALFDAPGLLVWAAGFFAANAVWFPLVEEPGLVRRFGAEYEAYRAEVPRWFPRIRRPPASPPRRASR